MLSLFRKEIQQCIKERSILHIPQLPLTVEQTNILCELLKSNVENDKDKSFLLSLFTNHIVPGVDETTYVKAQFLNDICSNKITSPIIHKENAIFLLGTMQGGYNIPILLNELKDHEYGYHAYKALSKNILLFDHFYEVEKQYKDGNVYAQLVLESWGHAHWFKRASPPPDLVKLTVFKVDGETNTDDLSPAQDAWSRPDIPLHARSMLKTPRPGIIPDKDFEIGPLQLIKDLKKLGNPIAYVGDVVGTGSSRKSATNSIMWHFGETIPYVPGKKRGGYCLGGKIAPIFYNTMEDSGGLPIEMDVTRMETGQEIVLDLKEKTTRDFYSGKLLCKWDYKSNNILDSVRANGRINLIIGKTLTDKAKQTLKDTSASVFIDVNPDNLDKTPKAYTLAQKMVGKACGKKGILPGTYCEPIVTSVGSQDTTGPMTRDELKDLACLGFSADLVMQSFCHTAAYPKPVDIITHTTLPDFIKNRGGISLKPGDGIIHSWLNRMLLPDTVGTGGDSHTRFPIGISFPAGSGLVAFAAATGKMPLDMPDSVLVRFHGDMQPGITLRDLVHAIPYVAKQRGLLTIGKQNKINVFNGKIIEIEGLPDLTCEQAFELSDASAERSAAGCTIKLNKEPIIEYLQSNIVLLRWMIREGYGDVNSIERRITRMEAWIKDPVLMEADKDAHYATILDINLQDITEPILCAPNDPDDAVLLSEVTGEKIEEVFIGSCMTNIGHFRATGDLLQQDNVQLKSKLWIAPPTKMDEQQLKEEGYYDIFRNKDTTLEMPGCSLCMGNQARVEDNATVLSTSTRNFPNRLGKGANVYLASAELSAITAIEGEIPSVATYKDYMRMVDENKDKVYRYMNFHTMQNYVK
jgi:aconitate hydratase 2/2-methylisocitrate dehydratase